MTIITVDGRRKIKFDVFALESFFQGNTQLVVEISSRCCRRPSFPRATTKTKDIKDVFESTKATKATTRMSTARPAS